MVVVALLFLFLMNINSSEAKDLGIHGVIHSIEEEDPIALIQEKLKNMIDAGELKKHNLHIQKRTKESVERPSPVKGISKATKTRRFTYDPTFTVSKDIKDHKGKIIHPKGKKVNPLEMVTMTENLIFIDGDDLEQKEWVLEKLKKGKIRLILVKGAPLSLSEELEIPVYFDQGGAIVKQLGIEHIPTVVFQEGKHLSIEEVALGDQQ